MKKSRSLSGIFAAAGMLAVILNSETALRGAKDGIELCLHTVAASLFPFIYLGNVMGTSAHGLQIRPLEPVCRRLGLPKGSTHLLFIAILGGYPAGAKAVADAYNAGYLERRQAEKLLPSMNIAGPAFIFGMIGQFFSTRSAPWFLWGIHLLSAFLVGMITAPNSSFRQIRDGGDRYAADPMGRTVKIMGTICGWVILFRMIVTGLEKIMPLQTGILLKVILRGLLELSNGCISLGLIEDERLRFILCSGFLAFGGICVFMQTDSVTDGLSLRSYVVGKILQCIVSAIFATFLVYGYGWCIPLGACVCFLATYVKNRAGKVSALRV